MQDFRFGDGGEPIVNGGGAVANGFKPNIQLSFIFRGLTRNAQAGAEP
jgi:hypothetical protein